MPAPERGAADDWRPFHDDETGALQVLHNRSFTVPFAAYDVLEPNFRVKRRNRWRIKVHNRGPAAARHVLVRLVSATTPPRYGRWTGDYPYPVYPVGTTTSDLAQTLNPQRQVNANSFQDYEIISGWEMEDGKLNTSLNTKGGPNDIFIEPDERWRLDYEVISENADPVHFTLENFVESNEVKVSMVDAQGARQWRLTG